MFLTSTDLQTRRARCQHQLSFLVGIVNHLIKIAGSLCTFSWCAISGASCKPDDSQLRSLNQIFGINFSLYLLCRHQMKKIMVIQLQTKPQLRCAVILLLL